MYPKKGKRSENAKMSAIKEREGAESDSSVEDASEPVASVEDASEPDSSK